MWRQILTPSLYKWFSHCKFSHKILQQSEEVVKLLKQTQNVCNVTDTFSLFLNFISYISTGITWLHEAFRFSLSLSLYIYNIYIYIIYIYIYISIRKPFKDVLDKQKIVSKTHLFSKIFRFLYISFLSLIKSKETSNKNQHSN